MSQRKRFAVCNIKSTASDQRNRIVTGVAAVFGNVDAGGDVVAPGAFRKAVADFKAGRSRARFLWNHDSQQPPIARILDIKEVARDQLPASVLAKDPTATGGLVVKRQYFKDEFSDRIYKSILAGAINEMSFAYDVTKSSDSKINGKTVRLLEELVLYDLSDVNFGMNAATVAAGAKGRGYRSVISPLMQLRLRSLKQFVDRNVGPSEADLAKARATVLLWEVVKDAARSTLRNGRY